MDSEGKVFEYFNWARGEGVKWNKVEWFFNNKNVTIRAITEIQPGDEIIFVPNSCMISKEIAVSSEVGIIFTENKHIFENNNEDSQILILVTFLIWEKFKEKNSKRYYYISSQPKTFKLIQDWSEEELKELQDLDLVKMVDIS
ncbi:unnamed protein product [Blepharisma stoltei]|uniref:Uncharacterized protein n=1 Tax=Blepharisma stoltei TaxID=1481888 RepID=A0AAU9I5Q1_9CILI|nr:unnamed protein product [Blepharisma stoltei]